MSSSIHRLVCGVTLALLVAMPMARADWQEPQDGTYNEKQIANYFQVQKEAMDYWKAAGKAIEGSPSGAAAMAMSLNNDARFRASLTSHGLSQQEFRWDTALTNDISEGEQGLKLLDESAQTYATTIQEQKAKTPVPPQNVELLKKHIAEFETVWGVKTDNK
jgi:hypothetical protein